MPFQWKPSDNPRKKVDPEIMKSAVKRIIDDGISIRAAALEYGLDRKTLGCCADKILKGQETTFKADHNSSQIFSKEEDDLEKYLITSSNLNYGLTPKTFCRFSYEYAIAQAKKNC